jgi:AcrR family transcriptional regulator
MRSTSELREQILAAARTEFARRGFAGGRIDRIASAASAIKERLYAHFGDKEALFREVLAVDVAEFFQAVQMRPDAVPEFVGDVFDINVRRPEHHRMVAWAHLEGLTLGGDRGAPAGRGDRGGNPRRLPRRATQRRNTTHRIAQYM